MSFFNRNIISKLSLTKLFFTEWKSKWIVITTNTVFFYIGSNSPHCISINKSSIAKWIFTWQVFSRLAETSWDIIHLTEVNWHLHAYCAEFAICLLLWREKESFELLGKFLILQYHDALHYIFFLVIYLLDNISLIIQRLLKILAPICIFLSNINWTLFPIFMLNI